MKLQDPYTGVIVDASETAAPLLMARGFTAPKKAGAHKPKAELLAEAEAEMTNAELAEAIGKAKKSPAKPKSRKKA